LGVLALTMLVSSPAEAATAEAVTAFYGSPQTNLEMTSPKILNVPADYKQDNACLDIVDENGKFKPGVFKLNVAYEGYVQRKREGGWFSFDYYQYYYATWIDYSVTCGNGITYEGTAYFEAHNHGGDCDIVVDGSSCGSGIRLDGSLDQWTTVSPVNINTTLYDPITDRVGSVGVVLPNALIAAAWNRHIVATPHYAGGVHKLAVPVVFVNGLGFDYDEWGVTPAGVKGSDDWLAGKVTDYDQGSLPDVMSRAYGLAKGADINSNGIYFMNLDFKTLTNEGQAASIQKMLTTLSQIMLNHVTISANLTPEFQFDIVCHSTGCLAVRKFIEEAQNYSSPLIAAFNPVDHIRHIVSVNAPHLGTSLASSNLSTENPEVGGLPTFAQQMDLTGQAKPQDQDKLFDMNVNIDYSSIFWDRTSGPLAAYAWLEGQFIDLVSSTGGLAGYSFDDFHVTATGGLFGPHNIHLKLDDNLQWNFPYTSLQSLGNSLKSERAKAIAAQSEWLSRVGPDYPRKTNGQYISFTPFYSAQMQPVVQGMLAEYAGQAFAQLCLSITDENCSSLQVLGTASLQKALRDNIGTYESASVGIAPWFNQEINDLGNGWLANSDLLVEKSSQIWGLSSWKTDANGNRIIALNPAKTYDIHYSEVPEGRVDYPVTHGSLAKAADANGFAVPSQLSFLNSGAPLMGKDLFCALEPSCAALLASGANVIYMGDAIQTQMPIGDQLKDIWTQLQTVLNDFNLNAIILSGETVGIAIQDENGNTVAVIGYDVTQGTFVWQADPATAVKVIKTLLPPEKRPVFGLKRVGNTVTAIVTPQTGAQIEVPLASVTGSSLRVVVLGNELNQHPALLIGTATLKDQATQPVAVKYGDVKVLLQERGFKEDQQSRPWFWLVNNSDKDIHDLKVTYYFSADPARNPIAEMDYPKDIPFTITNIAGSQWALTLSIANLPAKSLIPGTSGMQMRLHYEKWTSWVKADDYSLGTTVLLPSEHVVIHDSYGRVIWGTEPPASLFAVNTTTQTEPMQLQVSFADGGATEAQMIRPRISVKNLSSIALEPGYQVFLTIPGVGSGALPTLEDWYSPDCQGSMIRSGTDGIVVRWIFDQYRLYAGQEVSLGDWGIHWSDWRAIAKAGLAPLQISILDAQGNLIYGQQPVLSSSSSSSTNSSSSSSSVAGVLPTVNANFQDGGASESNVVRPLIHIQNTGTTALPNGYQVHLFIPGINKVGMLPTLEDWYSQDYSGSLKVESNGLVHVTWVRINDDLLASEQIDLGNWGVHYDNWPDIDKSQVGNSIVVVMDSQGHVVYGQFPAGVAP